MHANKQMKHSRTNLETAGFHEAALARMLEDRGGLTGLATSNADLADLLRSYGIGGDD